ncbi:heavy-metal-associated domain-containing protein [Sulfuriflexus sp.]|uniref:heavy-metal-associated domain-containing protein n=1 Tax=Sulfuriflexus sp. TaxID=2015443 RepID=UPI0028CEBFCD|nr:heavy-metal-associated domain-containing protein [Sulfuriflexus sp.]MDT8404671.1 heavy-metal-associated domain-containing protein [Sulfuriflexus sp.]
MKKQILFGLFGLLLLQSAFAAGTHYEMRVDGLACPFCAYGIEKNLKAIEGTANINVDLDKGLVSVDIGEGKALTEEQMKKLFDDSGFTYRSMIKKPLE